MKSTVHPELARAIDENFGRFLHDHDFRSVPNNVTGRFAKWVAVYDGPEFRLEFELDSKGDLGVVASALDNRFRGGALQLLLRFLSGFAGGHLLSTHAQAEALAERYREIADLLRGRDEERFRAFEQWVESNWAALTDGAKSAL